MNSLKEAFSRKNMLKNLNFFGELNLGLILTAVGIVYFKNPNHFAFGGTSGLSILLADLFPKINVGGFMWIINLILVVLGFVFLGIKTMGWTIYSSFALSFFVSVCEWLYPVNVSMSGDAMLDLVFAVFLPALGAEQANLIRRSIMNNPYEVLGVSETATDEEVKAAYRNLAKKYHPDNYTDSPLADVAEQKMKEINEAYDMINQMRQKGKGTGSTGSSSYNANSSSSQFYNVRIYIQRGLLDQADQILENTAQSMRTAEWHYLKGMIAYRRGWSEQAFSYFTTACNMDPNNTEYRAALNNMQNQRAYNYGGYTQTNPNATGSSFCDVCAGMMCANCLCDCCRMGC